MIRIKVVLVNDEFQFTKDFEVSTIPQPGWIVLTLMRKNGGYVSARVKFVRQYLGANIVEVFCETGLGCLCKLYLNNMGWEINIPGFEAHPDVKKMINKIKAKVDEAGANENK